MHKWYIIYTCVISKPPAAMIRGNHGNCRAFATEQWLGEFMKQLSLPCYTHSVLDVIQCLLDDSPEVLNLFSPRDIATIVNILNTSGRDEKVRYFRIKFCFEFPA